MRLVRLWEGVGSDATLEDYARRAQSLASTLGLEVPTWSKEVLEAASRLDESDMEFLYGIGPENGPSLRNKFLVGHLLFHSSRLGKPVEVVAERMVELSRLMDLDDPGWTAEALTSAGTADEVDVRLAAPALRSPVDATRVSIPRLIATGADLDEPLWALHDRLTRLAPLLGHGPPPLETTYLGVAYGDLVEQSRKDHPPGST